MGIRNSQFIVSRCTQLRMVTKLEQRSRLQSEAGREKEQGNVTEYW
jgi:hypothetical protein